MKSLAIIIPFYQLSKGILTRCLASVFQQNLPSNICVKIIVIDDESPVPAQEELEGICVPLPFELIMIKRKNGGPGSARNSGLNIARRENVEFVAFLDSDDIWEADHLGNGLIALSDDADFYFCDHNRWHNSLTWFGESESRGSLILRQDAFVRCLSVAQELYEFLPDKAFYSFLVDYLAQTSTVIYRFSLFPELHFDTRLRYAGEDHMFWLELASRARCVRFSRVATVTTGRGVNIYISSIFSWDHPDAARRLAANVLFNACAVSRFRENRQYRGVMQASHWHSQREFAWVWARKAVKEKKVELGLIADLIRQHKMHLMTLPLAFLSSILSRPGPSA